MHFSLSQIGIFGNLQGNISGSGGEVAAVVATAVALALFIALVPGSLGQLVGLCLQQLIERLLYTVPDQFFDLVLITSALSCTIFSDMVCCLLSEWCVATSFYLRVANHVSFIFAQLILPYLRINTCYYFLNSLYSVITFDEFTSALYWLECIGFLLERGVY